MFSSIIISGALAQDHEFIYPFYRLLEEKSKLDVCLINDAYFQSPILLNKKFLNA